MHRNVDPMAEYIATRTLGQAAQARNEEPKEEPTPSMDGGLQQPAPSSTPSPGQRLLDLLDQDRARPLWREHDLDGGSWRP